MIDMVDYLANRWFYWKIFRTKVAWRGTHDGNVDLEWSCQNQVKVIIVFLNGTPIFYSILYITYSCSLSRDSCSLSFQNYWYRCNKYTVIKLCFIDIFRVMELESYSTAGVIHVCMRVWVGFLHARVSTIYSHWLTYAHEIESNPS